MPSNREIAFTCTKINLGQIGDVEEAIRKIEELIDHKIDQKMDEMTVLMNQNIDARIEDINVEIMKNRARLNKLDAHILVDDANHRILVGGPFSHNEDGGDDSVFFGEPYELVVEGDFTCGLPPVPVDPLAAGAIVPATDASALETTADSSEPLPLGMGPAEIAALGVLEAASTLEAEILEAINTGEGMAVPEPETATLMDTAAGMVSTDTEVIHASEEGEEEEEGQVPVQVL